MSDRTPAARLTASAGSPLRKCSPPCQWRMPTGLRFCGSGPVCQWLGGDASRLLAKQAPAGNERAGLVWDYQSQGCIAMWRPHAPTSCARSCAICRGAPLASTSEMPAARQGGGTAQLLGPLWCYLHVCISVGPTIGARVRLCNLRCSAGCEIRPRATPGTAANRSTPPPRVQGTASVECALPGRGVPRGRHTNARRVSQRHQWVGSGATPSSGQAWGRNSGR